MAQGKRVKGHLIHKICKKIKLPLTESFKIIYQWSKQIWYMVEKQQWFFNLVHWFYIINVSIYLVRHSLLQYIRNHCHRRQLKQWFSGSISVSSMWSLARNFSSSFSTCLTNLLHSSLLISSHTFFMRCITLSGCSVITFGLRTVGFNLLQASSIALTD